MKEYVNLFYLPMYIAYAYWGLRWAKLGRQFMKGQKQYKPWLKADEYVNKNAGWHYFFGGTLLLIICITLIVAIPFEVFAHIDLFTFFGILPILGMLALLIIGVSFYMLRERILQLEPKSPENEGEL